MTCAVNKMWPNVKWDAFGWLNLDKAVTVYSKFSVWNRIRSADNEENRFKRFSSDNSNEHIQCDYLTWLQCSDSELPNRNLNFQTTPSRVFRRSRWARIYSLRTQQGPRIAWLGNEHFRTDLSSPKNKNSAIRRIRVCISPPYVDGIAVRPYDLNYQPAILKNRSALHILHWRSLYSVTTGLL